MNISLRKVGNSDGVILPKDVLKSLCLTTGDNLELSVEDGAIVMRPVRSDIADQLEAARLGMAKYRVALRELAK